MDRALLAKNLAGVRRSLVRLVIVAGVLAVVGYLFNHQLIQFIQRPLSQPLAYFKVTEAFYAGLKVSLFASLFLVMPLILLEVWKFAFPFFWPEAGRYNWLVTLAASFLFYGGASICYLIVLPAAVKFLVGYAQGHMEPLISVDRYLSFASAFIFGFGLTFQLPLAMVLLARAGVVTSSWLVKNFRYAVLAIVVVAAIITPTPDVYNLSLMAGPLLALYGASILLVKIFGKRG